MIRHIKLENGQAKCGSKSWGYGFGMYFANETNQSTCRRCNGTIKKTQRPKIEKNYVGQIFLYSYGYDMTFNEFFKVISQSEKSLLMAKMTTKTNGSENYHTGEGKAWPGDVTEKTFRAVPRAGISDWFCGDGKSLSLWDGKAKYENHCD